ncbi:MAG: WG repeat-containing protein [Rhodothermales bacterium]|nr:WG repeat-containing protein [Rhodothermales bacterium]
MGPVMPRVGAICLVFGLALGAASAQEWRYPVRTAGGFGIITEAGEQIDAGPFAALTAFDEPLGPAKVEGRWGFVGQDGAWVIEPKYLEADRFAGTCSDTAGDANDAACVARVRTSDGWILIDQAGRQVTATAYPDLTPVGDGLAGYQGPVSDTPFKRPGLWGVLSVDGRELSDPVLDGAAQPSEGLVPAQRYRKFIFLRLERRWGFVDASGDWVIEPRFTSVRAFSDGLALVSDGKQARYINAAGDSLLTVDYPAAHPFSNGLARVAEGPTVGFIDRSGDPVIPLRFEAASDFAEGRAAVRLGGEWGYIDTAGNWVIEPRFQVAGAFQGPLARVVDGGREYYINGTGRIVWSGD